MFGIGQAVKCIAEDSELSGPYLVTGKIYHVKEFTTPQQCLLRWPDQTCWTENGGRIVLSEAPNLEWFARRFEEI